MTISDSPHRNRLTAALLIIYLVMLLDGCDRWAGAYFGAADVPMTRTEATRGMFRFNNSLDAETGPLTVGRHSDLLGYAAPDGGGSGVTFSATRSGDSGEARSDPYEALLLEVPLESRRIPGTIAFWVRLNGETGPLEERRSEHVDVWIDDEDAFANVTGSFGLGLEGEAVVYGPRHYEVSIRLSSTASELDNGVNPVDFEFENVDLETPSLPAGRKPNARYHIAVTYDAGATLRLYVDGERIDSGVNYTHWHRPDEDLSLYVAGPVEITDTTPGPSNPDGSTTLQFTGRFVLDNLHIYSHARSTDEIAELYADERPEMGDE